MDKDSPFFISFLLFTSTYVYAENAGKEEDIKEGTIKIVYNVGVAPLKFEDEAHQPLGYFPDLWRLLGEKTGNKVAFIRTESFGESLDLLKQGKADLHAGLKAVSIGNADAALGEDAVVRTLINNNLLTGLRISGEVDIGNPDLANLRIGVRDDWPLLHSTLMKAMAAITPQQMHQIQQMWIPAEGDTTMSRTNVPISSDRMIPYGIAIFLVLSLLVWILIKKIKKENIAPVPLDPSNL